MEDYFAIRVNIAERGARYLEENGSITQSETGHVWYTLINYRTGAEYNFGFHPSVERKMYTDPGVVRIDDAARYLDVAYQKTFPISREIYNAIYNFSQTARANNTFEAYFGGGNACIQFTWAAFASGGIYDVSLYLDSGGKSALWPANNKPLFDVLYNSWMSKQGWKYVYHGDGNSGGTTSWGDLKKSQDTIIQPSLPQSPTSSDTQKGNTQLVIPVTVQKGDSLDETIASAFKATGREIVDATKELNGSYACREGTVVQVPVTTDENGNVTYFVQKGDNWDIISTRTGVPIETLWANNKKLADQGIFPAGEPIRYNVKDITTSGTVVKPSTNQDSGAASQNTLVDTSATFDQKWQYNFQINLGPINPAFVHAEPIDGYRLEYNPNGVLWNVNAAGKPTVYDLDKYVEQQRIIERTTNQTITEVLDSSNLTTADIPSSNLA